MGRASTELFKMAVYTKLRLLSKLRPLNLNYSRPKTRWTGAEGKHPAMIKIWGAPDKAPEYDPNVTPGGRTQEDVSKWVVEEVGKNWKGYGCYPYDKHGDWWEGQINQMSWYGIICVLTVFFAWYKKSGPEREIKIWARREALLLIREREKAGVPYLDMNLVDPAKLELPTD